MPLFYACAKNDYKIVSHRITNNKFIKKMIGGQIKVIKMMVTTVFHMCDKRAGTALKIINL